MIKEFKFKNDMKFGVATASTQIEGGDTNSNWNDWYNKGGIKDGSNPARANDHYNRFKEDIDLMASLGIETYRFSIEWSRLEPEQGKFDASALSHYREEIEYMISKGIKPLLTLHHFNNPLWFEKLGGFINPKSPQIFLKFVSRIVEEYAEIVEEYVTVNEPNVYATSSYYFGEFPPGEKSIKQSRICMTNLACCHILCYKEIHKIRESKGYSNTKVGYASHLRVFEPYNSKSPIDRIGAKLMEKMFQGGLDETCLLGKRKFPLFKRSEFVEGKYYEFIGINYYSRSIVKGFDEMPKEGQTYNDMGWEIYPNGIKQVCEAYCNKYKAPIYVTENGTPDREDKFRARFIYDHLYQLSIANANVERYYHWTFIDNFEWMDGEKERFGLVELDYQTQERKVRQSGYMYSEVIKEKGFTDSIIQKYLEKK